jgi:hypothetical protein
MTCALDIGRDDDWALLLLLPAWGHCCDLAKPESELASWAAAMAAAADARAAAADTDAGDAGAPPGVITLPAGSGVATETSDIGGDGAVALGVAAAEEAARRCDCSW